MRGRLEHRTREQSLPPGSCRGGERHPGLPDGVVLRGSTHERRPRSVRHARKGSSLRVVAPMTADVRRSPRRGTSSAYAIHAHAPIARATAACFGQKRVLHLVLRPVHVDRHYTPPAQAAGGGALELASWSGKPAQAGATDTGVDTNGRSAARRASPVNSVRKEEGVMRREKEGGHGLRPCEDRKPRLGCPHVVIAVAEVGRRSLASNTLGKRAPKKSGQGRVNGGLARDERRHVKVSTSASSEKATASRPHRTKHGEDRRKTQGDVRASFSGRFIAKSGAVVAGPGL